MFFFPAKAYAIKGNLCKLLQYAHTMIFDTHIHPQRLKEKEKKQRVKKKANTGTGITQNKQHGKSERRE